MRAVVMVVLVYGCSSKGAVMTSDGAVVDTVSIDADPCAASTAPVAVPGCVFDGLGQIDLNGAWTFTGTYQSQGGSPVPTTATYYLARGTDACAFGMSSTAFPPGYMPHDTFVHLNDTMISESTSGEYPHMHEEDFSLCVRDSDQALHYHSHSYVSMPMADLTTDGVLTR